MIEFFSFKQNLSDWIKKISKIFVVRCLNWTFFDSTVANMVIFHLKSGTMLTVTFAPSTITQLPKQYQRALDPRDPRRDLHVCFQAPRVPSSRALSNYLSLLFFRPSVKRGLSLFVVNANQSSLLLKHAWSARSHVAQLPWPCVLSNSRARDIQPGWLNRVANPRRMTTGSTTNRKPPSSLVRMTTVDFRGQDKSFPSSCFELIKPLAILYFSQPFLTPIVLQPYSYHSSLKVFIFA